MNDVHIFLGRGDAALALLLKAVKDKHRLSKLDGVHGAVSTAHIVFHHFKPLPHQSLSAPWPRRAYRQPEPTIAQNKEPSNIYWQGQQVFMAAANPFKRFFVRGHGLDYL